MEGAFRAALIAVVVTLVTRLLDRKEKKEGIPEETVDPEMTEAVKSDEDANPFAGEGYVISNGKFIKGLMWFFFCLFTGGFLFTSVNAIFGGAVDTSDPVLVFGLGLYAVAFAFGVGVACIRKVRLKESEAIYTTAYGKKIHFAPSEFDRVFVNKDGKITAYANGKKVIVIEKDVTSAKIFLKWCSGHHVETETFC